MERQCPGNAQYSRREYLDIMSIPRKVSEEVLEEKVLKIFENLRCDISPDCIEACHHVVRTTDTVIVKFLNERTE